MAHLLKEQDTERKKMAKINEASDKEQIKEYKKKQKQER